MSGILEKPSRVINGINFYDTDKVSLILQTSCVAIRRKFRNGEFPPVKFAGKYHMKEEDLLRYLKEGKFKNQNIVFSDFLNYKEMKKFDIDVIKETEEKLKKVEEIIEKNRRIIRFINNPLAKIILESYIKRYDKMKKEVEESKKEPISPDDMY